MSKKTKKKKATEDKQEKQGKKSKKNKKEFLTKELNPTQEIEATFSLRGIEFRNRELFWDLKMVISADLKEYAQAYAITLKFNDSAHLANIEEIKNQIAEAEKDNQLFDEIKNTTIRELQTALTETENEMNNLKKELGIIEFGATTSKIDCETKLVVFKVEPDVVVCLIKQWKNLANYKIILEPVF